jgi:hypothetical protein
MLCSDVKMLGSEVIKFQLLASLGYETLCSVDRMIEHVNGIIWAGS